MDGPESTTLLAKRPASTARRRFTADEYHRMSEAGVLHPDERTELIDGEIILMAAIDSPHVASVFAFNRVLGKAVPGSIVVSVQSPIRLDKQNELEPDLALLAARADSYREALPSSADVLPVIEVADSSLRYDRETKLALYARNGIQEAWIVDVKSGTIELHREPKEGCYQQSSTLARGEDMEALVLPGARIAVSDVV